MTDDRLYYPGETKVIGVWFYTAAGVLADPATVTFRVRSPYPLLVTTTYVYGPAPEITKPSTGHYELAVPCTAGGDWDWDVVGANVGSTETAVLQGVFHVERSLFEGV